MENDSMPHFERIARTSKLLHATQALKIGSFTTKSGRQSSYFINTGEINTGPQLQEWADLYAEIIAEEFGDVDNVFGPAYKGIPLAVAVSMRLSDRLARPVSFTFNRKEAKTHGEKGFLVGHQLRGDERVVIVEDVMTRGTAVGETLELLANMMLKPRAVVVGVDRCEPGYDPNVLARDEIASRWQVPVRSVARITDLLV